MNKRLLAIFMSLIIALSCFQSFSVSAMTNADNYIAERINQIKKTYPVGSYFTNNGSACPEHEPGSSCSNCKTFDGCKQCRGFAHYVFYNIFGINFRDSQSQKVTSWNYSSNTSLLSNIRVGDYVDSSTPDHAAIISYIDGSTIKTYEANTDFICNVNERSWSYSGFLDKFDVCTIYRSKNYNSIIGDVTSSATIKNNPSRNTYTETNAIVYGRVDKSSSAAVTQIGCKVWKDGDSGNYKTKFENPSKSYVGSTYMEPYYNMNTELGFTLAPGTTYWYQIYAVVDGKEYWSSATSFKTAGTAVATPSKPTINVSTGGADIVFNWNSCTNTDTYDLYIYKQNEEDYYVKYGITGTSHNVNYNNLPDGTYMASVASVNNASKKYTFSDQKTFDVKMRKSIVLDTNDSVNRYTIKTVTGINCDRGSNDIIIYDSSYASDTNTNYWGVEFGVDSSGKIVTERAYMVEQNPQIPNGGFVISLSLDLYDENFVIGNYVKLFRDKKQIFIFKNKEDYDTYTRTYGPDTKTIDYPVLKRDGYAFAGWYSTPDGGTLISESTVFNNDVIVYALYNPIKHIAAKAPTCTADGNIEYWQSVDSGKYYSDATGTKEITLKSTKMKAKGHSIIQVPYQAPTCNDEGNIEYWICINCGQVFSDATGADILEIENTVIPKRHSLVHVPEKLSTYTEFGNMEYWICTECGMMFGNKEGTGILFEVTSMLLEANPGDINCDEAVNAKDVLLLKQWLAKFEVKINKKASDVNADYTVNAKDLLLLRQYFAKWPVVLKKSPLLT